MAVLSFSSVSATYMSDFLKIFFLSPFPFVQHQGIKEMGPSQQQFQLIKSIPSSVGENDSPIMTQGDRGIDVQFVHCPMETNTWGTPDGITDLVLVTLECR